VWREEGRGVVVVDVMRAVIMVDVPISTRQKVTAKWLAAQTSI